MLNFQQFSELITESMNVYVSGYDFNSEIKSIEDICGILERKVLHPILSKLPENEREQAKVHPYYERIVPDGSYHSQGEQVINFYTAGFTPQTEAKMLQGINYFLKELGVKFQQIAGGKSGMWNSNVVRFRIDDFKKTENPPPQLNLSNDNATLIFRDVLNFPEVEGGGGFSGISPQELYMRIENLPPFQADIHQREPYAQRRKGADSV